jgi:LPS-assembly protein
MVSRSAAGDACCQSPELKRPRFYAILPHPFMPRCRLSRRQIGSSRPPADTWNLVPSLRRLASVTLGAAICQALQPAPAQDAWDCQPGAAGWECRAEGAAPPAEATGRTTPPPAEAAARPAPPAARAAPLGSQTGSGGQPAEPPRPTARQSPAARPAGRASAAARTAGEPKAPAPSQPLAEASEPAVPAPGIEVPESIDAGLAWTYCGPPPPRKPTDLPAPAAAHGTLVEAEADAAEGRLGDDVVTLSGDVRVRQGSDVLRADRAEYDRARNVIDAQGNVLLARPDARVSGETAHLDRAAESGEMSRVEYRLVGTNARGTADVARFRGSSVSDYENITYTTCRPGRDDWVLNAGELEIDRAEGLGDAKDATLRLGGVPVAYLPRLVFPIDDRRRSGLLFPTLGTSDSKGFDIQVPYYLNLAPNYDATLVPRFMSKRGFMLGGEFRHLSETSSSKLRGQILPDDWEKPELGVRGAVSVEHRQSWGSLVGDVSYNQVSDDFYLSDFGNSLTLSSTRYLTRRASLAYGGNGWALTGLVSDYQSVDATVNPYRILPGIYFDGVHPETVAGQPVNLAVGASYINFDRDTGVTGQRLDLYPSVTAPLRSSWGYAVPKLGVRYTDYGLANQVPGQSDRPDRLLGIASFDSGLFFERQGEWLGSAFTQTLEPRLYYVYIPYVDQDELPVFDTSQYSPMYETYFLENIFTGPDRINDANRVSLGVTTRLIPGQTGIELLRLSLGQAFFFDDRLVQLPGNPPGTSTNSPTFGEIGVRLDRHWSAVASGQWEILNDASSSIAEQSVFRVAYQGDDGRFVRAGYGKTEQVTEFTDLAFTWPVTEQVSVIGRWSYSLDLKENMEALAGIEYGSCCWRLRAFARQYLKTASGESGPTGEQDLSFFVQLELRGLGAVGDDIEELLDRSLHGYVDDRNHRYY